MLDNLYDVYETCRHERLTFPPFPLAANTGNEAKKEVSWEKTIELLYTHGIEGHAKFIAPLDHEQENYGDLLIAYNNMRWALIEFKKNNEDRSKERKKYVSTNPEKYLKYKDKSWIEVKHEKKMFETIVEGVRLGQISMHAADWRGVNPEPHFFIFSPKPSQRIRRFEDLEASLYWGAWTEKLQAGVKRQLRYIPIGVQDIPEASATYADFVRYAACIKLAKSGKFPLAADADGDGNGDGAQLEDLSLVIGLTTDRRLGHVSTLDAFLTEQKRVLDFNAQLNANPVSAPASSPKPA